MCMHALVHIHVCRCHIHAHIHTHTMLCFLVSGRLDPAPQPGKGTRVHKSKWRFVQGWRGPVDGRLLAQLPLFTDKVIEILEDKRHNQGTEHMLAALWRSLLRPSSVPLPVERLRHMGKKTLAKGLYLRLSVLEVDLFLSTFRFCP